MIDLPRIRNDFLALVVLGASAFLGVCLVSYHPADPPSTMVYPVPTEVANLAGEVGAEVAHRLFLYLGLGAWVLLGGLIVWDVALFKKSDSFWSPLAIIGGGLCLIPICVALHLVAAGFHDGMLVGSGGYAGVWGLTILEGKFAHQGIIILLAAMLAAGILLTADSPLLKGIINILFLPLTILLSPFAWKKKKTNKKADTMFDEAISEQEQGEPYTRREKEEPVVQEEPARMSDFEQEEPDEPEEELIIEKVTEPEPEEPPEVEEVTVSTLKPKRRKNEEIQAVKEVVHRQPIKVNPPVTARKKSQSIEENKPLVRDHRLPELDLLEDAEEFPYDLLAKKAQIAAATLEKTFQDFNLNVKVTEVDTGPVITQFELELEAGLRLSKVAALADDLAIALRVPSVRVVAPIPGKNTVGVEVPNEKQVMVRLRELIENCTEANEKYRVPFYVGKDVSGRPLAVDLTKMPHLLIAGRTGTGKSVCLNTLILSMLMTRSPEDVKMLMIDPKMVELSPYKRVPHLMHPVITDMKKAEAVLAWAVDKMEERYDLLARVGVRHLDSYNKLSREARLDRLELDDDDPEADMIPEKMPYIIIIADEMADMMMTSGKDVEGHIIRLAQKSRAVGIHLVLATQKPTVDVITGLIKSNLPARISFQVASRTDSRVVLDENGADRLLGNGDMLYLAPGTSNVTRAQGTYVSDEEVNDIIDFYSDQEPQYSEELAQLNAATSKTSGGVDTNRHNDELYEEAVDVVVREGRGSVSLLQRCLGIGYGRAARLVDYMAEDGIVGDYNGSQAREVLYTPEQWEAIKNGHELVDAY